VIRTSSIGSKIQIRLFLKPTPSIQKSLTGGKRNYYEETPLEKKI